MEVRLHKALAAGDPLTGKKGQAHFLAGCLPAISVADKAVSTIEKIPEIRTLSNLSEKYLKLLIHIFRRFGYLERRGVVLTRMFH